ncbi:hypothetical protein DOTSEDRAFT_66253 [Dothistroma septosporum NZE10]|uniref:Uncharacterized protein n=1 Tax=Dothistroma septosporum (strain NZE10 / CBS 128990) TaxID=675120 RepID=M2WJQ6_DOTSN|nr:hypothetical protein DOTSEDRAFT_66253 [Dothistroma septosporum NZE10]
MFATRSHDENAIHQRQQAAAAKPLNQGVKGLAPKTPAGKPPKTPFGKTRNDENVQRTVGKGGGKNGQLERNVFITPANPQTRAPLGAKTTNGRALKSPGPFLVPDKPNDGDRPSSTKQASLRRSKIRVHESVENDILSRDPEDREIEYMPPRGEPLPEDYTDDFPYELSYAAVQGKNLTRGWWSEYDPNRKEDNDDDSELSDFDQKFKAAEERERKELAAKKKPLASKSTNATVVKAAPGTMKAKSAATALGSRSTKMGPPTFSAPTAATKARQPFGAVNKPLTETKRAPIFDRTNPRFTAAKAASNSTIGYSKGRVVSANRRPLTDIHAAPKVEEPKEDKTSLAELLQLGSVHINDGDDDLLGRSNNGSDLLEDDDEPEVFQLDVPQDL